MDDLIEFLLELLDCFFDISLNSRRVPKIIKYIMVILLCTALILLSITLGLKFSMIWGKIFCFVIAFVFFIFGIRKLIKIYRS